MGKSVAGKRKKSPKKAAAKTRLPKTPDPYAVGPRGLFQLVDEKGKAVAAEGGYRVTGTWRFASGGKHATWLGGHCCVYNEDGSPRLHPKHNRLAKENQKEC